MATHKDVALLISSLSLGLSVGLALCLVITSAHRCPDPHTHTITVQAPVADTRPGDCDLNDHPVILHGHDPLQAQLGALVPVDAGKSVAIGDEVLARWTDGSWWEATVLAIDGPTITVAWRDGSAPIALTSDGVAPLSERPGMTHGDLALCKWQSSTRWWRAVIVEQQDGLQVKYIDGTIEPFGRQCIPATRS